MNRKMMTFLLMKMITGTMMAITSKHWFLMWMGLETKTMSMLPIMISMQKRRKVEATMKYFMMQALAAAAMLKAALIKTWKEGSWLIKTPMKKMSSTMMTMALFFKLSMAPFHMWFPEVIKGMSLTKGLLMTTWQKMAPTIMTMKMMKNLKTKTMMMCSVLSILMGSWKGLNQTQTRKILAFSSMKHMGWMMMTALYNQKASLIMLLIYMMMKSTMFTKFMKKNTTKMTKSKKKNTTKPWKATTTALAILSLGGLPPLTGFMKKLLSFKTLIKKKVTFLTMPLIIGSLLSLFFYLRMAFKTKMTVFPQNSLFLMNLRNSKKKKKKKKKSSGGILKIMSLLGMLILPIFLAL